MMKPNAIGMFVGKNELTLITHGIYLPVSGWIAVFTTV
jgi:hypothetical protein